MQTLPVSVDPEIMSGTLCFTGTRVPLQNLLDYLLTGETLDEFLEQFPGVQRSQVEDFMEMSAAWMNQIAHEQAVHENPAG